ncbi:cupin domain-containing protein [Acuticoccus mangrovi]|uniref:Cupin domain-containing protein n=1 Tax=Acuticoccus mangrovi TaxID=2796142 RepID=A0A934IME7_9HYPH|nr:cupin domain-containing protein [Acuticoccus mangrovi]MBJ3774907.1 cupin domain-containing protein [Acuticoccus mangrovi]
MNAPKAFSNRDEALKALYDDLSARNMFPFWATSSDVEHDEVRQLMGSQKAVPFVWSYKEDIEPILHRAAELVTMDDSERRSLILVNPGLNPRRATVSTMYTAYRLNDPNEIMPPHRHSPNAIRFGLIGSGNFTGVEGEDITFGPGDMVLTPIDTWHNHGTVGDESAVNLSVLDLPLVETLNSIYFEHDYKEDAELKKKQTARFPTDYSQRIYGHGGMMPRFVSHKRGTRAASPMYVYRWDMMREILEKHKDWDGDPYEALMVEYIDPTTGGPVFKTITFFVQMLRPGEKTMPLRQTASLLVAPFEGKGYSIIDGQKHEWNQFDTLAVPGGSWCQHVNASDTEPTVLFVASDEPALKAFNLFNRWGRDEAGDTVHLSDR